LIDATNAIRLKPDPYPTAYHAFEALTKAEVVKCFNSTGFENMLQPDYNGTRLDMFMAGKSEAAKKVARQLARDAGFATCYDFGDSDRVALLEQFALAWINLAIFQGEGRQIGFKVLRR
jgi:predicted dinucleotide-binding enzyme